MAPHRLCPTVQGLTRIATTNIPLYSMRIRLCDLFIGYEFCLRGRALLNICQAAQELQACLNTQWNLTQSLQCKFDDISDLPRDGDDDSTPPPKKRGCTQARSGNTSDPDEPSVEEAETDEVKRLGRRFVILYGPWLRWREHLFEVELDEDYDEKDWFKDTNTMVQGQLHEIRGLLPEKYHRDAFTKRWLSKSVSNVFTYVNVLIAHLVHWWYGLATIQHCDTPQESCCHHLWCQCTGYESIHNQAREVPQYDRLDYESTWPGIIFSIEGRNPSQWLQRCVWQTEGVFEFKVNCGARLILNRFNSSLFAHLLFL